MKRFGRLVQFVVLIVCGLALYRALYPPQIGGAPFSQLPAQTQKQRRAEAQKLVEKLEEVARAARQSRPTDPKKTFVIEASEEQLNTLLQDRLRTEKFPISDLRVGLESGLLRLQGTAQYGGVSWPATVSGTLEAHEGTLRYRLESLTVSGLPAPTKLRDKAQKSIESGLQKAFARQNRARIDAVQIAPGKLTLRGQTG